MPEMVPTQQDFDNLANVVEDLEVKVRDLEVRVLALENEIEVLPPEPEPPDEIIPPEPPVLGAMQATVMLDGNVYVFEEVEGEDLGDYLDPDGRFVMSCHRVTHPDLADYRVDFRRIEGWSCVVFDFGNGLTTTAPANLPSHTVTITDDLGVVHAVELPAHYHAARWRWQSGPWPHMRTIDDLVRRKWLPQLDPTMNKGTAGHLQVPVYTPMGLAGLTASMPATGGRADIGFLTDWQGEYQCTRSPEMLQGILAQGEAGGTIPWHFRDPATGALLNLMTTWKYASCYWTGQGNVDPYIYPAQNTGITIDVSHMPACAWMPFALTGDPYFLETQQAMANYAFLDTPRNWNAGEVWQMPGAGQTRAMAWNLRTIAEALAGTPADAPEWLLPRSCIQMMLDQCVKGLTCIMDEGGTNREGGLYAIDVGLPGNVEGGPGGYYPANCYSRSWQTSFFCQAAAFGATLFPELRRVAGYIAKNQIARTDGKVWDASYPAPYSLLLRPATDALWFANWTECWAANAPLLATPVSPLKNQLPSVGDYDGGVYAGLCALAYARAAGVSEIPIEVNAALQRYAEQMTALLGTGNNYLTWNNSYAR